MYINNYCRLYHKVLSVWNGWADKILFFTLSLPITWKFWVPPSVSTLWMEKNEPLELSNNFHVLINKYVET